MDRAAVAGGGSVPGYRRTDILCCFRNADRAGLGIDRAALFRGVVCYASALVELDHNGAGAIHRAAVPRFSLVPGYFGRTGNFDRTACEVDRAAVIGGCGIVLNRAGSVQGDGAVPGVVNGSALSRAAFLDRSADGDIPGYCVDCTAAHDVLNRRTGADGQIASALNHRSGSYYGTAFQGQVRNCQRTVVGEQRHIRQVIRSGNHSHSANALRCG